MNVELSRFYHAGSDIQSLVTGVGKNLARHAGHHLLPARKDYFRDNINTTCCQHSTHTNHHRISWGPKDFASQNPLEEIF